MPDQPEIVRLRITLNNVKPTVMRRIKVPLTTTLNTLHEIIQAIMPWEDYHAYAFYLRMTETRWSIPVPDDLDFGLDIRDSTITSVAQILAEPNFKVLRYTYDFGDDWRHTIKVERRFSSELWDEFPRLIKAKGRCPPEDVGGPCAYAEYLEAMSDPTHPRHVELIDWLGYRDPNEIDTAKMQEALSRFVR